MNEWLTSEALEQGRRILAAGPICDECLGRGFARLGHGLTNATRGRAVREALDRPEADAPCWVCDGLFDRTEAWATQAVEAAAGIEFDTYLFGVQLTPRLEEMEAFRLERFPTDSSESLKHAFNRTVGRAFEARIGGGTVDFADPHLSFVIDLANSRLSMHVASLYIYARYRKLVRGIPQTRWPCRKCRGKGCSACGMTGKQYAESVEEWIGAPLLEAAQGAAHRFHGAGREDIDARMLGTGRPFVLEVVSPRCRTIDLSAARERINDQAEGRVEVSELSFVDRSVVARLKSIDATKRYAAEVSFDADVAAGQLDAALASLLGEIEQRTPVRVSHRRADKVRTRRVLEIRGEWGDARHAVIEIEGEGGLYIKELISGDGGRTVPSLAERLDVGARVTSLDVLDVSSKAFDDLM